MTIRKQLPRRVRRWTRVLGLTGLMVVFLSGYTRHTATTAQTEFFPLHRHDTWTYRVHRPTAQVSFPLVVTVRGEHYCDAIALDCQIVEERHRIPRILPQEFAVRHEEYTFPVAYYVREGFVHRLMSLSYEDGRLVDSHLDSAEYRFLPLHLQAGVEWESSLHAYEAGDGLFGQGSTHKHRVVKENALVVVPAGRFQQCLRVETETLITATALKKSPRQQEVRLYYVDWYAPGVGLVKSIQKEHLTTEEELSRIELVTYHVHP